MYIKLKKLSLSSLFIVVETMMELIPSLWRVANIFISQITSDMFQNNDINHEIVRYYITLL